MELRKPPFRYRALCGLGFFVVGLAGIAGAAIETGAAVSASLQATNADWHEHPDLASYYNTEHSEHQLSAIIDALSAGVSIAASSLLLRGAYSRFMHMDGNWAWEGMAAAENAGVSYSDLEQHSIAS